MSSTPQKADRKKHAASAGFVLLVGVILFKLITANPPQLEPKDIPEQYPAIEVQVVDPQPLPLTVTSHGTVRPRSEVTLKSEVTGQIAEVASNLVDGGVFSAGDALIRINDVDYQGALAKAETSVIRAQAELQQSKKELDRIRSLNKRNLASQAQLDQAETAAQLADARLRETLIQRESAKNDVNRTVIRAPFDGRVRSEAVERGQFVSRGETLTSVYAMDFFEVRLPISLEQFIYIDIPRTNQGSFPVGSRPKVTLTAQVAGFDAVWEGELERTEGEINSATGLVYGVVKVKPGFSLEMHAAGEVARAPLLIGMYVEATIQGRLREGLIELPRTALRDDNHVLVVDENSRLRYREVNVYRAEGDTVLISSGLNRGEQVCVSPLLVVVDGMRVNTRVVPAPSSTASRFKQSHIPALDQQGS